MALSKPQEQLLEATRKAAKELGPNGKALTPVVGELMACDRTNLRWEPSDGYDVKDRKLRRVQIKTRKS